MATRRTPPLTAQQIDLRIKVGKNLRSARLAGRLSQVQLAERAGISAKHIGQLEMGRMSVTIDTLFRLATALDSDIRRLVSDSV
jgi:transcriptional regulator with XRE-family HTH domain